MCLLGNGPQFVSMSDISDLTGVLVAGPTDDVPSLPKKNFYTAFVKFGITQTLMRTTPIRC